MSSPTDDYIRFSKPGLGKLLRAFALDAVYTRAEGDLLSRSTEGGGERRVLDLVGSFGATLAGHNHPELLKTFRSEGESALPNLVQGSIRTGCAGLARRLWGIARRKLGADFLAAFFNTGSEAVEAAIKHLVLLKRAVLKNIQEEILVSARMILRRNAGMGWNPERVETSVEGFPTPTPASSGELIDLLGVFNQTRADRAFRLVALENAYHGKTLGALGITFNPKYRSPFEGYLNDPVFLPLEPEAAARALEEGTMELARLEAVSGKLAIVPVKHNTFLGIFIEPVLGEGGAIPLTVEYVRKISGVAKGLEIPLVVDEIQTGMGRTGTFFSWERFGLPAPDFLLLSKFLGGGIAKISSLMVRSDRVDDEFGIIHSSTFAEDELSARMGLAVIEILERNDEAFLSRCREKGFAWLEALRKVKRDYPEIVKDVRGCGLLIGVEFSDLGGIGSNFLRFIFNQGDFGYLVASYLLNACDIRVAPTLNSKNTIRIEPSVFISQEDIERTAKALATLCGLLRSGDTFPLVRHLLPEFAGKAEEDPPPTHSFLRDPADMVQPPPTAPERVAFLGHFIDPCFLARHEPPFSAFTPDQLRRLIDRTWESIDPCAFARRDITSSTGTKVHFNFIGLSVTSAILLDHLHRRQLGPVRNLIRRGVETARDIGCRLVGFGQFTSILTNNCQSIAVPGVAFTSGNTLTTGMAFRGIAQSLSQKGWDSSYMRAGIVGGGGNIGSTLARLLADSFGEILLIGRSGEESRSKIDRTAYAILEDQLRAGPTASPISRKLGEVFPGGNLDPRFSKVSEEERFPFERIFEMLSPEVRESFPIRIGSLRELETCPVLVCAVNSAAPFISPEMLGPEVLVCDVSIPPALLPETGKRTGVEMFKGGVVALPNGERLNIGALPLEPGLVFSCMAETIILGMERHWADFSIGPVRKEQVLQILALADKHGFKLARLKLEEAF